MAGREDIFQQAMNEGHSHAWDQAWDKAAAAYQKALAEFPENSKAIGSLGLALFQLQRYDEALKVYIRAAQLTPEDPVPFEKVALLYERQGNLNAAIQASSQAGELYLRAREVEKSVENWVRVVQLNPEHIQARSRLAMIHEKTGQTRQAVMEYIALASILQNSGNPQKALEMLGMAARLEPANAEVVQAMGLMKAGKLLPRPTRPKGGTGPLRMAQVKQLEQPREIKSSPDPIAEARQKALSVLADVLFDLSDDSSDAQSRRGGLQSIMRGTGQLSSQSEQTKILLHLSTSIDAQTKNNSALAADELELAIENGFNHPAGFFFLGVLRSDGDRSESALRNLQQCIKHSDYALAARIVSGRILIKLQRIQEAAVEYLEALKIADADVVDEDQSDIIRQLYEPLIESIERESDQNALSKLCDNIEKMLMRQNWRQHLVKTRAEMPKSEGGDALPLAEILIQAQSSQVLEAMNHINQMARANHLRTAMDEAFHALTYAPTYLPLHSLIGDLLIRDGRTADAITKFTVVASSYSVRGEPAQATKILKRIIQLSPMDLAARTRLIEQLTARGQVNEAVSEYIDLADIYYRLAELDMARKTYTTALRLAQQPNADSGWSLRILQRMADIDMQRLDWKQAMRVYEQIRTLRPDDGSIRQNLIDLSIRMGQPQQAISEIESYVSYLDGNRRQAEVVPFIEKLIEEHPEQPALHRTLAEQYKKAGRVPDAITQLDTAGELYLQSGNKTAVVEVINQILLMNPPNVEEYRTLLSQVQNS